MYVCIYIVYTCIYMCIYIYMVYIYICVYNNDACDIFCFSLIRTKYASYFFFIHFSFFVSHIFLFVCCLCLRVLHVTFFVSNWFVLSTNLISFYNVYASFFCFLFMSFFWGGSLFLYISTFLYFLYIFIDLNQT